MENIFAQEGYTVAENPHAFKISIDVSRVPQSSYSKNNSSFLFVMQN